MFLAPQTDTVYMTMTIIFSNQEEQKKDFRFQSYRLNF
jgi:hypothetical protein